MPKIAVIPGDGIGTEVTREAVKVLRCLEENGGPAFELVEYDLGADRYLRTQVAITEQEMAELESGYAAILLGAMGDPRVPDSAHARAILLGLRFRLDLYVNLRPVQLYDASFSPLRNVRAEDVDIVVVRENTEGVYVGLGGNFKRGTLDEIAIEEDVNTRKGVERIIRAAFEFAQGAGRRRVTLADKANAMQFAGSLYRRVFAAVSREYPDIENEAMYVDALAMDMVLRPSHYDVIVASNLFGDVLSDLAAALVGGLGLAPSANLNPCRPGLFEPVHGSAPNLAGKDQANPLAAILTAALMLENLGHGDSADRVRRAVRRSVSDRHTTPDLGGNLGTRAVGDSVCRSLTSAT
jgi:3-isopropylmalate dehydrogenase